MNEVAQVPVDAPFATVTETGTSFPTVARPTRKVTEARPSAPAFVACVVSVELYCAVTLTAAPDAVLTLTVVLDPCMGFGFVTVAEHANEGAAFVVAGAFVVGDFDEAVGDEVADRVEAAERVPPPSLAPHPATVNTATLAKIVQTRHMAVPFAGLIPGQRLPGGPEGVAPARPPHEPVRRSDTTSRPNP